MANSPTTLDKIVSLAKRRGFIFQGSEIYGGLAGTWDYGPLGVTLKNNIKNLWWKMFVESREDIYGVDAAILMHPRVWEASGHVAGFSDPLQECKNCNVRVRNDHWLEAKQRVFAEKIEIEDLSEEDRKMFLCSKTGTEHQFGPVVQFNMMFQTQIGVSEGIITYLRPETAGGIFINFKNVVDSLHPKIPFGIAQIGKAFRNEIAPRDFVFRSREFEQMEVEHFVRPSEWQGVFDMWREQMRAYFVAVGIMPEAIHEIEIPDGDRAHYSKRTIDFEFEYPFGRKELSGLAYRTDFDLMQHAEYSKVDLSYFDEETKERFVPHVVEPSFGLDRIILAVLSSAYSEDGEGDEKRVFLKLPPAIAPVRAAVFPLLKNKPELVTKAREVYANLKRTIPAVAFDDNGNIGKRYRRQDEIGTPFCVTIDFETLENDTVTVRDRDSGAQKRVAISKLTETLGS